ncbi:MAG: 3'-5' exonuclease [Bacillota bacterium]|nr:3'-5' exonuclease [Bacillota bacterium]
MLDSLFRNFDSIIVLDVETTGLYPKRDEIIELAALRIDRTRDILSSGNELDLLVKLSTGRHLPPVITGLTGISEKLLEDDGITKELACERFLALLDCSNPLLAAYNAQFDLNFIYHFLTRFGKADLLGSVKMLDAMTVYKDRRTYPHTLKDAVSAYKLKTQNTHRAIDDVKATFELLCAMEQECDDLERYINLFGYNPRYGINGRRIDSVRYLPQPYDALKKLYE